MAKHGFEVVKRNARWQFEKKITPEQTVILDFHAPSPEQPRSDLRVENRRVKPARSLGDAGIHGRENPEANAAALHPFAFTYNSVDLLIPHPVAFAIMKLIAMNDRWQAAATGDSAEARNMEARQARKHAEDLMRIIAMTTRAESDLADTLLGRLRGTPSFRTAADVFANSFMAENGWAAPVVSRGWRDDDFAVMQTTLARWFGDRGDR